MKDRVMVLPAVVGPLLQEHLRHVRQIHARDMSDGLGRVELPFALEYKYPNAGHEWMRTRSVRRNTSSPPTDCSPTRLALCVAHTSIPAACTRRSNRSPARPASPSVSAPTPFATGCFLSAFATHLLENGYDDGRKVSARTVQELLGHKDVKPTMIYTGCLLSATSSTGAASPSAAPWTTRQFSRPAPPGSPTTGGPPPPT